jgi:hypothetical protein
MTPGDDVRSAARVNPSSLVGAHWPLVAGVEEKLHVGRLDEFSGGIDIAFLHEDRIGVHPVDLRREVGRPRAELRWRKARVEEQRTLRTRAGLGELLRGHDTEREACVDELVRQRLRRALALRHDLAPADLLGVSDVLLSAERRAHRRRAPTSTRCVRGSVSRSCTRSVTISGSTTLGSTSSAGRRQRSSGTDAAAFGFAIARGIRPVRRIQSASLRAGCCSSVIHCSIGTSPGVR